MQKKGLLVVFSGPSGVGKGTIMRPFMKDNEDVKYSVSATTREPRPGEIDGVNYHFLTKEEFLHALDEGEMLEHTEYNGNYYGTPRKKVEEEMEKGYDVILEIEVQGAQQVRRRCPTAVSVFVMPPSYEELAKRLRGRNTEKQEDIERRLSIARREIDLAYEYDYILLNDNIDDAVNKLGIIIGAARCSSKHMREFIDEVNFNA